MEKIYYNKDGWLCLRYPNDFPVEDETSFIEVEDEEAEQTYFSSIGYAWKVIDGELVNEVYDESVVMKQIQATKIALLKTELVKIKEDIEQEVFGLVRDDFAEKKARAAEIVNELRMLEGKEPREVRS